MVCYDFTIGSGKNLEVEVAAGQRQGSAQPAEGKGQARSIKPRRGYKAGRKVAPEGWSMA